MNANERRRENRKVLRGLAASLFRRGTVLHVIFCFSLFSACSPDSATPGKSGGDRAMPPFGTPVTSREWWDYLLPDSGRVMKGALLTVRSQSPSNVVRHPELIVSIRNVGDEALSIAVDRGDGPVLQFRDRAGKLAPLSRRANNPLAPNPCYSLIGSSVLWELRPGFGCGTRNFHRPILRSVAFRHVHRPRDQAHRRRLDPRGNDIASRRRCPAPPEIRRDAALPTDRDWAARGGWRRGDARRVLPRTSSPVVSKRAGRRSSLRCSASSSPRVISTFRAPTPRIIGF